MHPPLLVVRRSADRAVATIRGLQPAKEASIQWVNTSGKVFVHMLGQGLPVAAVLETEGAFTIAS